MSEAQPDSPPEPPKTSRRTTVLLWSVAVLLMLSSAVYQRRTGPTRPLRGSVVIDGRELRYELIRSDWSSKGNDATAVTLPEPGGGAVPSPLTATLHYRRFKTEDPFTAVVMGQTRVADGVTHVGTLPAQPAAGKLEYYLTLESGTEAQRVPEEGGEMVVIRFKDHVPIWILLPHVLFMFFAVLFGMRAGLGALFAPAGMRGQAWVALIGMTAGGMILGPIVQKFAFGAYWTGFPVGGDWTDNKMLVMWLVWVIACAVVVTRKGRRPAIARPIVLVASLAMTAVYLIPHSTRGSELDYSQVDQGVDPAEAIETGR